MYCIVHGLNGAGIEILWRFQFYNLRLMFPGVFSKPTSMPLSIYTYSTTVYM